jgi:hypothetical protein
MNLQNCYFNCCFFFLIIDHLMNKKGSRDSVVGIATRYGLDGLGIESW